MIEIGLFVFAAFVGVLIWKVRELEKRQSALQANYTELYRDFHELNLLVRPRDRKIEKQQRIKEKPSSAENLKCCLDSALSNLKNDGWELVQLDSKKEKELIPPRPSNEIVKTI